MGLLISGGKNAFVEFIILIDGLYLNPIIGDHKSSLMNSIKTLESKAVALSFGGGCVIKVVVRNRLGAEIMV